MPMTQNKKALLSTLSLAIVLLVMALAIENSRPPAPQVAAVATTTIASTTSPFAGLSVEAKSAYVYLPKSGRVLYAKDAETPLALASLTKVMTAFTAAEYAPEGTRVLITAESLREEGDTGLLVGEEWDLRDLLSFSLVNSSNDGMAAVSIALGIASSDEENARASFIGEMNRIARELGLTQTYFSNETGLDTTLSLGGAYGSARDVAHLLYRAQEQHPEVFAATAYPAVSFVSLSGFEHTAKNTNEAIASIPGILASKTGFTDISGGNLAIVADLGIGEPVALAVLGSSRDARFSDILSLLSAARTSFLTP